LTDRRWHSSILNVGFFRGADCDTDHYMVTAKVRPAWKQAAQKTHVEKFNLKNFSEMEVRKPFQIKISKSFEA
jgi:hypothetical protein